MEAKDFKPVGELVPEAVFDVLARVNPGVVFVSLTYFTVPLDATLSKIALPTLSLYGFLLLLLTAYIVAFFLELAFFWTVPLSHYLFGSPPAVVAGQARPRLNIVYELLGGPLPANSTQHLADEVRRLFSIGLDAGSAPTVAQLIFDYVKHQAPSLSLVLVKIHAEAVMFRNLSAIFLLSLVIEASFHALDNPAYLTVLLIATFLSHFAFLNLERLSYRRLYQKFLTLTAEKNSGQEAATHGTSD